MTPLRIPRNLATPFAIGVFALMSVTGVLMFFHLDSGVQKAVHEWAGWAMLAGVALHAAANWFGFKRYFQVIDRGAAVIAAFALVTFASFFIGAGGEDNTSPPALAMGALTRAPIAQVAPLFGKTAAQARADLAAAGIDLAGDDASLASALGGDRGRTAQALRVLAKKA